MHLGDFGDAPADLEPVTFTYFGESLRANPNLSELDYIDFMDAHGQGDIVESQAAAAIKGFARTCLHADDFERFWATAKNNRQGTEQVFTLLAKIVEAATDRPTGLPSGSSDGQSNTGTNSEVDYSLAMRQYEGRPDLQMAIVRAHDAQAG